MKWVRAGAALAVAFTASYASAAPPEARLGAAAGLSQGRPASRTPPVGDLPARGDVAYGKALARLKPQAGPATRGAAETRIYQRAAPSVVLIVTRDALGSGVLISADGKIVTNLHVIGDEADVGVIFKPATEGAAVDKADIRKAKVLRRDEVSDLALVQVSEVPAGVAPLALGNSTTLEVGADVHAIGHPTGEAWTYTRGIVSQIRRAYSWTAEDKMQHEATVIQTQTPINPGNSGGPLLDDQMNVIGINSFKSDGEGLNFAVSAEDVKSFLARTTDRVAQAKPVAAACKPKAVEEEPTTDPKGMEYLMDTDCDGKGDVVLRIPTSKRDPIVMFFDDDGDGKLDTMYFDDKQDGQWDDALIDSDGDEEPDLKGYFRKGEDEPYKWEKIAPKR